VLESKLAVLWVRMSLYRIDSSQMLLSSCLGEASRETMTQTQPRNNRPWMMLVTDFAGDTTLHGIRFLAHPKSQIRRFNDFTVVNIYYSLHEVRNAQRSQKGNKNKNKKLKKTRTTKTTIRTKTLQTRSTQRAQASAERQHNRIVAVLPGSGS